MAFLLPIAVPHLYAATEAGAISGTVTDPQGLVVKNAQVVVIETNTEFTRNTTTNDSGFFSFSAMPVGVYEVTIDLPGFKTYRATNLKLDDSGKLFVVAKLAIGERAESVTTVATNVTVDTADTQLGEVITGAEVTAAPLDGRSFTDLLALQPGVIPVSSYTASALQAAGASVINPSGDLDPGTLSINGQREFANGFTVNGAAVEEPFTMGAGVIPNLDSIGEFRILTSNMDAEYGNYSGGMVSVVTKEGSNHFHGNVFEFVRNTDLDARNYFSPERGTFIQNQFGGTGGGPIKKDKVFFFGDYQGTRTTQGVASGLINVPSVADKMGNLSDLADELTGSVSGPYIANQLTQELGYQVMAGEPYYNPGCDKTTCVFPNATIPKSAFSGPAQHLLQYIPSPNTAQGDFSTSAQDLTLVDNKGAFRMDAATRIGKVSGYYFIDDYVESNPYPTAQGGATIPGFQGANNGRSQLISVSDTTTFGARSVNQFQASYMRDVNILGTPVGTVGTSLASQGFVDSSGQPTILPQRPSIVGVENIIFNNYIMGSTITGLQQFDNTYEYSDSFSRVIGPHTLKFGGEVLFNGANVSADIQSNGTFTFFGGETGSDFADFLVGVADSYVQGDARPVHVRQRYGGAFAQDSWRVNRDLEFNYGVRWDVEMPFYELQNQLQTLIPGEQSEIYPGAPAGIVFPGDPNVPKTLGSVRWNNFSPRLGLAYAASDEHTGLLGALLGKPGQSSLRLGFGRFFSEVEGVTVGVMAGDPPFGSTYVSPAPPTFANPFVDAATGFNEGQRFPLSLPPLNASPSHPNTTEDWTQFEPISGMPVIDVHNVSPYAIQYNLTLQRQLGADTVLTASYIGSEGHHLLVLDEANPSNPALCLSVFNASQVAPGTATCGQNAETGSFTTASGQTVVPRGPYGVNFGSVDYMQTTANSTYNALEVSLRHVSGRLQVLAGYTYGKSLDYASSISDQIDPFNPKRTHELSAYNVASNFVASYNYNLPIDQLLGKQNRLTSGWMTSGIVHLSTGLPVTMMNSSDNSLIGVQRNGISPYGLDLPQVQRGPLNLNHNPRNGQPYFNVSLFGLQPLGTVGNTAPRYFSGPGQENFDMAVEKNLRITESSHLEFRLEAFNVFNHAQFFGPNVVSGDVNGNNFGQVVYADNPRIMQAAAKFVF
jgi:hypothetical protein